MLSSFGKLCSSSSPFFFFSWLIEQKLWSFLFVTHPNELEGFPSGLVVKNLPFNAGDTVPVPERFHMWKRLSPGTAMPETALYSLCCTLQQEKPSHCNKDPIEPKINVFQKTERETFKLKKKKKS